MTGLCVCECVSVKLWDMPVFTECWHVILPLFDAQHCTDWFLRLLYFMSELVWALFLSVCLLSSSFSYLNFLSLFLSLSLSLFLSLFLSRSLSFLLNISLPPTDPLPHLSLRSHSSHSALRRSTHPHSYLFYHLYVPRRMVGCLACTAFFFFFFFFFPPPIFFLTVYPSVSLSIQQEDSKNTAFFGVYPYRLCTQGSKSLWDWPWIGLHPVWGGWPIYPAVWGGCVFSSYPRYLTHYLSLSCPLRHRL